MTSSHRMMRRLSIGATFVSILAIIATGIYYLVRPVQTCFDGLRNQGEREVDCGGPCAPCLERQNPEERPVIREAAFVFGGAGTYDVLAEMYNPNDELGLSSFRYTFALKDAAGAVIAERSGTSYLFPQESRFILEVGLPTDAVPVAVEFTLSSEEWERFSGYREKPSFIVSAKRYEELSADVNFSRVFAKVTNDSSYDFRSVDVKVILRDAAGKPLALNRTVIGSFLTKETREVVLNWPVAYPGTVAAPDGVTIEVDADIYHSDNILRRDTGAGAPVYR